MNLPLRPEVEAAFAAALELPETERPAFLAREYPYDPELRAEVESLLRAHRIAGSYLEPLPGGRFPALGASTAAAPSTIGRYRIHQLIGEGAMGVVYAAEQDQPRRMVALKVMKPGLAGPELLRRFEQEFHALGRLHHPGIAQIYEAGAAQTASGPQPYFAMEFIHGEPLTSYAQSRQLDTRQRLQLILKICDAVHHAHQRGIIHRDLKPGNILVDDNSQPKILDFGVARVANAEVDATRQTDVGRLVGTLAYMSPEQVLADPMELDTRSDVYALGVIFFELLAGRLPYRVSRQLHEAVRTIREEEPPKLGSFNSTYHGDIETIVAKALEKEKARRYSSAAELAADVQRYLDDEPIVARRASKAYHLRKFARRHKALVGATAAIFAVLIAGVIASTWEATRARQAEQAALRERDRVAAAQKAATRERDRALSAERTATSQTERAVQAEVEAVRARNRALGEKSRADTEAATAKVISDFLQNDLLAQAGATVQARPDSKPDPDLKVRTALDRAAARIPGKFETRPLVEAALRRTIGAAYQDLGLYPQAQAQYERALELQRRTLGADHTDSAVTMNDLADLYRTEGKYAQAEPLLTEALQIQQRVLGPDHPTTLVVMSNLAFVFLEQGRYASAEALYSKALEVQRRVLGDEHPSTLMTTSSLAVLYRSQGKRGQAEPLFRKVMESNSRVLGPEHPETLTSMNNLAVLYWDQQKYDQAEPLYVKVLELRRRVLGEEHPGTLNSMNNLAALYRSEHRYGEAEVLVTRVLDVRRRVLGAEHRETLNSVSNLARLYYEQRKYDEAEPLFASTLETRHRVLGTEHPDTLNSMNSLARLYSDEGRYEQAEPLFVNVLDLRRRVLGPNHPDTIDSAVHLAKTYLDQGKWELADPLLRQALESQQKIDPAGWQQYETRSLLGASLAGRTRFAEAEPLLRAGYLGLQESTGIPSESRSAPEQAGERLVHLYQQWQKPQQAAEWQSKIHAALSARNTQ